MEESGRSLTPGRMGWRPLVVRRKIVYCLLHTSTYMSSKTWKSGWKEQNCVSDVPEQHVFWPVDVVGGSYKDSIRTFRKLALRPQCYVIKNPTCMQAHLQ